MILYERHGYILKIKSFGVSTIFSTVKNTHTLPLILIRLYNECTGSLLNEYTKMVRAIYEKSQSFPPNFKTVLFLTVFVFC